MGNSGLCRCDDILPLRRRFGSEGPQRGPGDEVALKVERVVDGGMDAEEALGRASRLEPLHFTLASSHDSVRDATGRAARGPARGEKLPGWIGSVLSN